MKYASLHRQDLYIFPLFLCQYDSFPLVLLATISQQWPRDFDCSLYLDFPRQCLSVTCAHFSSHVPSGPLSPLCFFCCFFWLHTPFASFCSSSPSAAHLSAFVMRVTGFTICRCGSTSPLIFQYNANAGWWKTCGICRQRRILSLCFLSFSLICPFQSRQKAKQTATTGNYHTQRTKEAWSVFPRSRGEK